jgi:glyoxylate/hydroxypyruvate reductase
MTSNAVYPSFMIGLDICGSTVGYLGFGQIAQVILKRLVALRMKDAQYLTSKPGQSANSDYFGGLIREAAFPLHTAKNLDEPTNSSNIVMVACALTPSTLHTVNASSFAKMKKKAVLGNIGRGLVVEPNTLSLHLDKNGSLIRG